MKINWKVRFKNPVFWVQLLAAIVVPLLAGLGLQWEDMTSWGTLGQAFLAAVSNPVILAAVAVSVWNALTDPTTKGLGDSQQALTYSKPKSDDASIVQAINGTVGNDIPQDNVYKQTYPTNDKEDK